MSTDLFIFVPRIVAKTLSLSGPLPPTEPTVTAPLKWKMALACDRKESYFSQNRRVVKNGSALLLLHGLHGPLIFSR